MALNNRISIIDKATLTATGNSSVVCGSSTAPFVNTSDMIMTNGSTTRDWTKAGSSANLNILTDSTILYAELIWYSTVKSNDVTALDVRSISNNPINFVTPNGSFNITPVNTDSYTRPSGSIDEFRSADVTSTIASTLSGTYTVSNVPTSIPETGLNDTSCGWTLVVIYRNKTFRTKKIDFSSGITFVAQNVPLQTMMVGFTTSYEQQDINGRLFLGAVNAPPLIDGESLQAGPSFANLVQLGNPVGTGNPNPGTAPNNPYNSIFTGQVNICDPLNSSVSLIDISGTNGTKNHDGFMPTQVVGGRNKFDITDLDLAKALTTNQNQLSLQFSESLANTGTSIIAIGSQIGALAPGMSGTFYLYEPNGISSTTFELGEQLVFLIQLKNMGDADANNVIISTEPDPSYSFIPGSLIINGVHYPNVDFSNVLNIGTIPAKGVSIIQAAIRLNSIPQNNTLTRRVTYSYSFTSGTNSPVYTNTDYTNSITITVQSATLNVVKNVSKVAALVGDTLVYSIDLKNTGTQQLTNLNFQDIVDPSCSFVQGSVIINTKPHLTLDPTAGFPIGDMAPNDTTNVSFSAKVNSLPPSTIITNYASTSYCYQYAGYSAPECTTILSNLTSVQVQYIDIVGKRFNNNEYPNPGDTVTYTLQLTNIGNIPAPNVQVQEPTMPGSNFIPGSVTINGKKQTSLNPFDGFTLTDPIDPQKTTTITYDVKVVTPQPTELIQNIAQIPFKYQITPGGPVISTEKDSNKVTTRSNFVNLNIAEGVDKAYATIGDRLYYTVTLTNNGNIDAYNTVFLSPIQKETTFVPGSVTINGVSYSNYNPNNGFSIDTISPANTVTVTYVAKVNSVPNPNTVYNNSNLTYECLPDPNGAHLISTITSNTVSTIINIASYTIVKSVDKGYAQIGDALVYTTKITNTGSVPLTRLKFIDEIPSYLTLIPKTVYINGILYPNYNPSQGFPLDDLNPTDVATVAFGVTVNSAPIFGYVVNVSRFSYQYILNPNTPVVRNTADSNDVITRIINGSLAVTKSANMAYATIGDTINYTFAVSNNGNVTANNSFFLDTLPVTVSFIKGSVYVNNMSKPDLDPTSGFTLGTITTGQVVNVNFNVKVNSLPNPNTIENNGSVSFNYYIDPTQQPISKTSTSNNATTVLNISSATLTKQVDKTYASASDTLTYTVTAKNTGTVAIKNILLKDVIPQGATFTPGSVIIDGNPYADYNPNMGFIVPDISAGGESVITFKASVTSIPTPPTIINAATINYNYYINPNGTAISDNKTSNNVTTNVVTMTVTNVKSVDKDYATIGDTLTYTSVITNNGNVPINNVNFIDVLSPSLAFVSKSVKINSISYDNYDPNAGFSIAPIAPKASVTVTFTATVSNLPANGSINNNSTVSYTYNIDPNKPSVYGSVTSNTVTTLIKVGTATITKQANRMYAKLNDVINYSFILTNTGNTILKNISFKDTIQAESTFNPNSVYIDGHNKPGYDPDNGFALDDLSIGGITTINFSVTVKSIPSSGKLYNTGSAKFYYYVDPSGSLLSSSTDSNTTVVNVSDTIVSATKVVDKPIAKLGDTLTFTVTVNNQGNVASSSVFFKDLLDLNISFNKDSVYINGTNQPGYDPNVGFSIPDINANKNDIVTFTAKVITRPSDNIVENFADIKYQYIPDPQNPPVSVELTSNTTQTYIAVGELTLNKSVDKTYATVGDTINYTVIIKNTGSVNATALTFLDSVDPSATFVPKSVFINDVNNPNVNPNIGFSIPDLTPGTTNTVSFSIIASVLPPTGEIDNTATTTFKYQLTPSDPISNKSETSNTVKTYINKAILTLNKSVDIPYATIGDILTYTVTVKNTGDVNALTVFFQDTLQKELTFVDGSVTINTSPKVDLNPNTGFNLDNIIPNGTTTIVFKAKVNALPSNYIVVNTANANYSYYIDPNKPYVNSSSYSNTVTTTINLAYVKITKGVNLDYATVNDILVYTLNISNLGTAAATNINFRDIIPNGLTFVKGSVLIGGQPYSQYDPYSSFSLGVLQPGGSTSVAFSATVTSVPSPSLISNTGNLTYSYRINPAGPDYITEVASNPATTQINKESLSITKAVDKGYARVSDILTYNFVLTNTGNVDLMNVIFTDPLPSHVSFNKGSVKVNGAPKPDYDPILGFNLQTISTLSTVSVSFTVTINSVNSQYTVINYATGTFSYNINPNGPTYTESTQSNTVSTIIVVGSLASSKTVDALYATISDILNYSILVQNNGDTTAYNLSFIDMLSNGGTFVKGSVSIDGNPNSNLDPTVGFPLEPLLSGSTHTIIFNTKVTSLPTPPQVTNYATINGNYKVDPSGPDFQLSTTSNTVSTQVNIGSLTTVKSVDKDFAEVSDTLTYTSVITNTGNVNATGVMFHDILQSELTFVPGTVKIGTITNNALDPILGFNLQDLAPGQSISVTFDAKINALPTPPLAVNKSQVEFSYNINPTGPTLSVTTFSNPVTTQIVKGTLNVTKSVDKTLATIGDVLTYSISINNIGNVIASSVFFQDTPSTGATFNPGSVYVNNNPQPDFDPTKGFTLSDIGIGNVVTIQFTATVTSLPPTNKVTNQATVSYKYVVNPKQPPVSETAYSNTITTNIALGSLNVTKAVDKQFATIGQLLTYTVTVINTGNINATNVIFLDPTPANSVFVINSVFINTQNYPGYNPAVGFSLSDMTPGQIITVVYQVKVVS